MRQVFSDAMGQIQGDISALSDNELQQLSDILARNAALLAAMEGDGWRPEMAMRLDSWYDCPSAEAAEALRSFLFEESDYDLEVEGLELKGQTGETEIDATIIKDWTIWMYFAGIENGRCLLDGWGTAIPTV